ncbi:MAG: hypothetical protein E7445_09815 [Ruminococcaceae bacterium]|nr:hypothetical protein [Oscillospiraceae bacterium]
MVTVKPTADKNLHLGASALRWRSIIFEECSILAALWLAGVFQPRHRQSGSVPEHFVAPKANTGTDSAGSTATLGHSHSLTSFFPQLFFALFGANSREFYLKFSRFSLYSLSSQPVWYCFGITVWYQFSEKSAEKKFVILFQ